MSRITSHIYIGDITNAQDLDFLRSKNISLIVNCAKEIPEFYPSNFTYIHLHWDDNFDQNIISDLEFVSNKIIEATKENMKVFVHCAAGISRSSSVVIYTLMKLHHWPYDKTFAFVKDSHPRTQPNAHFVKQLLQLQQHLQNSHNVSQNSQPIQSRAQNVQPSHNNGLKVPQKVEQPYINTKPPNVTNTNVENDVISANFESNNKPSKYKKITPELNESENDNHYENGINYPRKQVWSKLTFDCENCELPPFVSNGKNLYARLF